MENKDQRSEEPVDHHHHHDLHHDLPDLHRDLPDLHHDLHQSSSSSGEDSGGSSPAHDAPVAANSFANDGSFLEMFKKKMEEEERRKREAGGEEEKTKRNASAGQSSQDKKPCPVTHFVGKRRGGARLTLKTGMVAKKQKLDSEAEAGKGDAWTKYMAEVKKYKAHQCGDDDKTRPLVK